MARYSYDELIKIIVKDPNIIIKKNGEIFRKIHGKWKKIVYKNKSSPYQKISYNNTHIAVHRIVFYVHENTIRSLIRNESWIDASYVYKNRHLLNKDDVRNMITDFLTGSYKQIDLANKYNINYSSAKTIFQKIRL